MTFRRGTIPLQFFRPTIADGPMPKFPHTTSSSFCFGFVTVFDPDSCRRTFPQWRTVLLFPHLPNVLIFRPGTLVGRYLFYSHDPRGIRIEMGAPSGSGGCEGMRSFSLAFFSCFSGSFFYEIAGAHPAPWDPLPSGGRRPVNGHFFLPCYVLAPLLSRGS